MFPPKGSCFEGLVPYESNVQRCGFEKPLDHGGTPFINVLIHLLTHNLMALLYVMKTFRDGYWEHVFEGCILSTLTIPPDLHEVSCFTAPHAPCHAVLSHHGPRSKRAMKPLTETPNTVNQNKSFFFLNSFSQEFITAMKN
jgi:hypothetical protein